MERQDQSVASVRGRVALIHASVSYELHRRQYKDNYDHRWQSIAILLAFFRVHLRHRPYLVPSFSSAGMPQIARDSPEPLPHQRRLRSLRARRCVPTCILGRRFGSANVQRISRTFPNMFGLNALRSYRI